MPKIDTLDALEEHEEHEDENQLQLTKFKLKLKPIPIDKPIEETEETLKKL